MRESGYNPSSVKPKANRLSNEKSPYLLQHAFNPVEWYPWGEEAFEKARREDKPIFLSIGYSTCYWCHVMEREVFENTEIANLMNRYVVSIKVDREERPDIDNVYMKALQAMTGSGGWPLSVFMTADRKPFFTATYIPPSSRNGRTGFPEILESIYDVWLNDRSSVLENCERLFEYINVSSNTQQKGSKPLTEKMLDNGFEHFEQCFDSVYGGFGDAPKFPRPSVLNFLLRYYHRTKNLTARNMALATLDRMAHGGIYDQLGSGFHRYSTDERWQLPHFEKMLYDQAQLCRAYLEAYQVTRDPFYAQVAQDVLTYVQRVMTNTAGGFYSAEDAESAVSHSSPGTKHEGAFYLWKRDEIAALVSDREARVIELFYNIRAGGNIQNDPRGEYSGENILTEDRIIEEIVYRTGDTIETVDHCLKAAKEKLFAYRELRPKPHCDDKILLSWNGLMISAFACAYQVLGKQSYLDEAVKAAKFITTHLVEPETMMLLRRYRENEAKYQAHLTDYAFFVQALLDLYESSFDIEWLRLAIKFTEDQMTLFYDLANGGFFDHAGTDSTVIMRGKEFYDGAEPSGNAVAILNLFRIAHMTDNTLYRECAEKSLAFCSEHLANNPFSCPQLLVALDYALTDPVKIIFAGEFNNPALQQMTKVIHPYFMPHKSMVLIDNGAGRDFLIQQSELFAMYAMVDKKQTAYICSNYSCELPVTDADSIVSVLEEKFREPILSAR